jgi:4-hydroxy-tetrahydrodipicolinate synthase
MESMSELFSGVAVALVTVFDDQGDIDPGSTAALASDLVARGIRAVLVCGTTGEAATLADGERTALIEAVRAALPGAIPVIAGTGAPSLWQAERLTTDAVRAGADAVLAWSPAGCKELGGYYAALASAAGGCPVLAYHLPSVSSPGVPVTALPALPVAGIKDSSGSPDRLLDELAHYPGAIYVGSSALLALAGPMGAAGAILALANVEPEDCCRAFAGDAVVQRDLADRHLEVLDGGPSALKRILAKTRPMSATSRVP